MKIKIQLLCFLTIILSLSVVSAADFSISVSQPSALSKSKTNTNFLITPHLQTNQSINLRVDIPQQITDSKGNIINLNPPYSFTFNNVLNLETKNISLSYPENSVPSGFVFGKYTINAIINAVDVNNQTNSLIQTVPINFVNDFCSFGENGTDLVISRVDIKNSNGDDTEWKPLDSITVKVEVSNEGTERIREVYVELGLIDSNGKNIIRRMNELNDRKISIGSLSEGKDVTKEFSFKIPFDFKEENYKLVVKAYSDNLGEKNLCTANSADFDNTYYQSISGVRETDENKQVIINNLVLSPDVAQCGEKVQLSGEVANIGDTDYEDKVKISLYNRELGINKVEEIETDLSQGDSQSFVMEFDIPETASEKNYVLEMKTYYDYDTSDESYNIVSDKTFTKVLKVEGNCKKTTPVTTITEPSISVELSPETPEAVAGKEVSILATIKNNHKEDVTYTISVSDNTEWSSLVSIEPRTITIPAGESKEVAITLKVDNNIEGDKEFIIKANYGDSQVKQYRASLTIVKQQVSFDAVRNHLRENWYIYLIVLVNLILIIAIISVIKKMAKSKKTG